MYKSMRTAFLTKYKKKICCSLHVHFPNFTDKMTRQLSVKSQNVLHHMIYTTVYKNSSVMDVQMQIARIAAH